MNHLISEDCFCKPIGGRLNLRVLGFDGFEDFSAFFEVVSGWPQG